MEKDFKELPQRYGSKSLNRTEISGFLRLRLCGQPPNHRIVIDQLLLITSGKTLVPHCSVLSTLAVSCFLGYQAVTFHITDYLILFLSRRCQGLNMDAYCVLYQRDILFSFLPWSTEGLDTTGHRKKYSISDSLHLIHAKCI